MRRVWQVWPWAGRFPAGGHRKAPRSHPTAALLAAQGDLVAVVPEGFARQYAATLGARRFPLPVRVPGLPISQQWHARLDLDPAQRWLREHVRASFRRVGES